MTSWGGPTRSVAALLVTTFACVVSCGHRAEFPYEHRVSPEQCPAERKPLDLAPPPADRPPHEGNSNDCSYDEDCKTGKNGRCDSGGHQLSRCTYDSCFTDGDCKSSEACACNPGEGNRCVIATCHSDADCKGRGCSPSNSRSCNGTSAANGGYFCHTPDDSCTDANDCGKHEDCVYESAASRWVCLDHGTCVG